MESIDDTFTELFPGVFWRRYGRTEELRILGIRDDLPPPRDRETLFAQGLQNKISSLFGPPLYRCADWNICLEMRPAAARHLRLIEPPNYLPGIEPTFCGLPIVEIHARMPENFPLAQLVATHVAGGTLVSPLAPCRPPASD